MIALIDRMISTHGTTWLSDRWDLIFVTSGILFMVAGILCMISFYVLKRGKLTNVIVAIVREQIFIFCILNPAGTILLLLGLFLYRKRLLKQWKMKNGLKMV